MFSAVFPQFAGQGSATHAGLAGTGADLFAAAVRQRLPVLLFRPAYSPGAAKPVATGVGRVDALVLSIIYFCARRVITFKGAMGCMTKGFNAMVPAILILTFAVSSRA